MSEGYQSVQLHAIPTDRETDFPKFVAASFKRNNPLSLKLKSAIICRWGRLKSWAEERSQTTERNMHNRLIMPLTKKINFLKE